MKKRKEKERKRKKRKDEKRKDEFFWRGFFCSKLEIKRKLNSILTTGYFSWILDFKIWFLRFGFLF